VKTYIFYLRSLTHDRVRDLAPITFNWAIFSRRPGKRPNLGYMWQASCNSDGRPSRITHVTDDTCNKCIKNLRVFVPQNLVNFIDSKKFSENGRLECKAVRLESIDMKRTYRSGYELKDVPLLIFVTLRYPDNLL